MKNFSDMVREERPDFKAVNGGFQTLNIVELISLIIGQGNDPKTAIRQSRQLVNICDGSLRSMTKRRTAARSMKSIRLSCCSRAFRASWCFLTM